MYRFHLLNAFYLSEILAVFHRHKHLRKFPMPHEEYLDKKAENLVKLIHAINPEVKKSQSIKLLDVGCGDCQLTVRVSQKLGAKPTGVDLKGPAEDGSLWSGEAGLVNKLDNEIVYYDGLNLIGFLKEKTENYSQLFDVVMLNHALHHYPGRKSQIEGLQQAMALLKEGGVMLLSEHATVLDDEFIELQHVLFDLKAKVLSSSRSKKSDLMALCQAEVAHYENEKHRAYYLSGPLLLKIAEALGLKAVLYRKQSKEGESDASKTIIIGFVKIIPCLQSRELERFQAIPLGTLMSSRRISSLTGEDIEFNVRNDKSITKALSSKPL
ncbi:bifunctional 2-polyprenyl-6-hydroxyphenol methylase/3-demethylubiquinol 3-O-methyltransferase UbiG [Legionella sp. km772]|uniref:class I SAM-dependent methyltransferase n=1 Tax=Legionella sp. km772 TaxID=2498111 RepID=UPI000F8DE7BB|nr:methyltransferase domain-containing protein [Legionella sp. km772]RUR09329.1 class I SAM-dependent methyltransferase [Legionella sp. km772]